MIRNALVTIAPFISVFLFPWPLSALLAALASLFEPLVPFAVGLFADTLYFIPRSGAWPVYTLGGLVLTVLSLFVRSRLSTGSIRR